MFYDTITLLYDTIDTIRSIYLVQLFGTTRYPTSNTTAVQRMDEGPASGTDSRPGSENCKFTGAPCLRSVPKSPREGGHHTTAVVRLMVWPWPYTLIYTAGVRFVRQMVAQADKPMPLTLAPAKSRTFSSVEHVKLL